MDAITIIWLFLVLHWEPNLRIIVGVYETEAACRAALNLEEQTDQKWCVPAPLKRN